MKPILIALTASLLAGQQPAANPFSGTWIRVEHLPRITWEIAFDETAMTLVESDGKTTIRTVQYNLDGTGSVTTSGNHQTTRHKLVSINNTTIVLSDVSPVPAGAALAVLETWQLSADGKTLKLVRKVQALGDDGPLPINISDVVWSFQRTSVSR